MDFAKRQLEKYGWKEGEGLGRNKTGIVKAIRPKLKFDTGGLGHDVFEDVHNTWWHRVYDEAAKNIITKKDADDTVKLETIDKSVVITTKRKQKRKHNKEVIYGDFVKTSELKKNVEKKLVDNEEAEPKVKKKKMTSGICDLTEEELFKVCGGRTAHKGARHGLKMNAKLSRIEQQEAELLKKLEVKSEPEESNNVKSMKHKKKKKKHKKDS